MSVATKEQRAEWNRRYRERHPERVAAASKSWRDRNPEKGREYAKRHREQHPEETAARTKDWKMRHPEAGAEYVSRFYERNPGKKAEYDKAAYHRHLEKGRARSALRSAVYDGRIEKPDVCERCGARIDDPHDLHGHHKDYSKPLEVEWLCRSCHGGEHH